MVYRVRYKKNTPAARTLRCFLKFELLLIFQELINKIDIGADSNAATRSNRSIADDVIDKSQLSHVLGG